MSDFSPVSKRVSLPLEPSYVVTHTQDDWAVIDSAMPAGTVLQSETARFLYLSGNTGRFFGELKQGDVLRQLIYSRPVSDHDPWQGVVVLENEEFYKPWPRQKS